MEPFSPLTDFYQAIAQDARIGTTHISLYMALLQQWNLNNRENPISIKRDKIMNAAKINSRHTYNRCMANLHEFGYIIYEPAVNSAVSSKVNLNYCEK
ncbi:MAG TPA: hypothetical protein PKI55_13655 [Chitinophagaceae bacterium]|nr:hypothetical protein [Chitinophagaceae bacterium]